MKKIIFSLSIMTLVAVVLVGGTMAVFSDSELISGNTVGAASVVLTLDDSAELSKPIEAENLLPGQRSEVFEVEVINDSTVPANAYMYVENLSGEAPDSETDNSCQVTDLEVWVEDRSGVKYHGPVTGATIDDRILLAENLEAGGNGQVTVYQQARLNPEVGDEYQGSSCVWDEVFVLEAGYDDEDPDKEFTVEVLRHLYEDGGLKMELSQAVDEDGDLLNGDYEVEVWGSGFGSMVEKIEDVTFSQGSAIWDTGVTSGPPEPQFGGQVPLEVLVEGQVANTYSWNIDPEL